MFTRITSRPRTVAVGVLLTALLALPAAVSAQTAELRGSVEDSTGSALPGVTVTIVNTATGVERVVVTDVQGGFRVPALQPGPYTVESSLTGFGNDTQKVVLTVGQVADLKVSLSVGTIQESVQVVGRSAVEIETTKSDLSAVVNQEQLSELPVLNRGFVGLAQLLPGGGPARTARRPLRHLDLVRRHQRPQHVLDADRRRHHGPPDLRLRDRQRQPGRRAGVPRAAQPVRRRVLARRHRRGQRRHPVRHQ